MRSTVSLRRAARLLICLSLGVSAGDEGPRSAVLTLRTPDGTTTAVAIPLGSIVTFRHDGSLMVSPITPETPGIVPTSNKLVRLSPLPHFEKYVRYRRSTEGTASYITKQTSTRVLRQKRTGRVLKLVGVHHLGTPAYFGLSSSSGGFDSTRNGVQAGQESRERGRRMRAG
jgi:hypothetical protein